MAVQAPNDDVASVLIVDDRPANLLAFEAALDGIDVHVVKASSGEEAVRLATHTDFAVALVDLRMPVMDGIATAMAFKLDPRSRRMPIMFITAGDDVGSERAQAYSLGAVDFLGKPVDSDVLRSKVSVFVELFRLRSREAQRAAEESALRELQTVADMIPALVWKTGAEGTVTYSNRCLAEYAGRDVDVTARPIMHLMHPDDRPRWSTEWSRASVMGTAFEIEARMQREDGVRYRGSKGGGTRTSCIARGRTTSEGRCGGSDARARPISRDGLPRAADSIVDHSRLEPAAFR
jgi:CheY-like chemotaxis protein